MGIVIRQSLKSSIVSYIGVFIGTINILWLSPKFLNADQLGLTRFLVESAIFFTSFAQLGIPHVIDKFLPHYKDENSKYHGFFSFTILYGLAGFILFCLLFLFLKDVYIYYYQERSPLLIDYFYYIIPLTFFLMYINIVEAYSRGHNRIVFPTAVREVFLRFANGILLILYGFDFISFDQMVIGLIFSYAVGVIMILIYIKLLNRLYLSLPYKTFSIKSFGEVSKFGMFIIIGGLGTVVASKIDIIMLPGLTNLNLTGVYVVALFIGTVIEIPRRGMGQISTPLIAQAFKENNIGKIEELYKKSSVNLLLIGCLIFIGVWSNIDDLFNIIPKSEIYKEGKYVVFFVSLSKLIDMSLGVNNEIILNSKYYRIILYYVIIMAALTVIGNLIFIPPYGITGAAMALSFSIFIYTIIKLLFVWSKYKIQPFTIKSVWVVLIALIVYGITLLFPASDNSIMGSLFLIAIKSFVIVASFMLMVYKFSVSEDLNALLINSYKRFTKKK